MRSKALPRSARAVLATLAVVGAVVVLANCAKLVPRESWSRKWGPMVPHVSFPGDCGICHVPEDWKTLRPNFEFDHAAQTGFVLEGAHANAACLRCHNDRGPVQIYLERGCGGCHVDPHKSALGIDCTSCHNQMTWDPTGLIADHAQTRFPLIGTHALAPCESCHTRAASGDYLGTPVDCHLCHQREALAASPNHVVNGWIRNCDQCHTPTQWQGAVGFVHVFFPLIGGHAGLDCQQCHPNGQFTPIPPDCFFCHENDYLGAPNHVTNNFNTDCTQCHNVFDWNDV